MGQRRPSFNVNRPASVEEEEAELPSGATIRKLPVTFLVPSLPVKHFLRALQQMALPRLESRVPGGGSCSAPGVFSLFLSFFLSLSVSLGSVFLFSVCVQLHAEHDSSCAWVVIQLLAETALRPSCTC